MTSKPDVDQRLVDAHDLALAALHEITPPSTVGPAAGYLPEDDGSVSLRFENRLPGYPGWYWTVTVARVDGADPTVLEVELMPGDGALLAPEWVPWAERLAEYRAHQAELAEQAAGAVESDPDADDADGIDDDELDDIDEDEDDLDDDSDDDDDDDDDLDEDELAAEPRVLHAGDLDGVDIDELDDSVAADEDSEPADDDEQGDDESDDDEQGDDEDSDDDDDEDSDDEE